MEGGHERCGYGEEELERSSGAGAGISRSRDLARYLRDLACSGFPLLCVASSPFFVSPG